MKQSEVLGSLVRLIGQHFKCSIYADEVKEKFKKPCFFISFTTVTEPLTRSIVIKRLSIFLTYFSRDEDKNEVTYLNTFDEISELLGLGINVGDRFIHIDDISESRVGEYQDILQIKLQISYQTIRAPISTGELIEEVDVTYVHK